MKEKEKPWYRRTFTRWEQFRLTPLRRVWLAMLAAFFMFSSTSFYTDLMSKGEMPYAVVLVIAVYSGLNAVLWMIAIYRLPIVAFGGLIVLQFFNGRIITSPINPLLGHLHPMPVPSETGIHFAATSMLSVTIISYLLGNIFTRRLGEESLFARNELKLAHEIQRTLVPVVEVWAPRFEIYGR
jgi:hypothetical protein